MSCIFPTHGSVHVNAIFILASKKASQKYNPKLTGGSCLQRPTSKSINCEPRFLDHIFDNLVKRRLLRLLRHPPPSHDLPREDQRGACWTLWPSGITVTWKRHLATAFLTPPWPVVLAATRRPYAGPETMALAGARPWGAVGETPVVDHGP